MGGGQGGRGRPVIGLGRIARDGGGQGARVDRADGIRRRGRCRRDVVAAVRAAEGQAGDRDAEPGAGVLGCEAGAGGRGDGDGIPSQDPGEGIGRTRGRQGRRPVIRLDHAGQRQGAGKRGDRRRQAGGLDEGIVPGVRPGDAVGADRDRLVDPDVLGVEQPGRRDVVEVHHIAGEQAAPDNRRGVVDLGDPGRVIDAADRGRSGEGQGRPGDDTDGRARHRHGQPVVEGPRPGEG